MVKNKVAPPFKEAEFDVMYGEGISKVGEIVDLGVKLDIIDKTGAWFTVGEQKLQGRDAVKVYLKDTPEICDQIEKQIRDNAHKLMGTQAARAAVANGRLACTAVEEGNAAVDVSAEEFEEG